MSEDKAEYHARYITTDYDDGVGPGHLFDADPRAAALRACNCLLPNLDAFALRGWRPNKQIAAEVLLPDLEAVARNYWRDFDYDERKGSAQVKAEVQKLVKPLAATIKALEAQPPFVRKGLNFQAPTASRQREDDQLDLLKTALTANKSLLDACKKFSERSHINQMSPFALLTQLTIYANYGKKSTGEAFREIRRQHPRTTAMSN